MHDASLPILPDLERWKRPVQPAVAILPSDRYLAVSILGTSLLPLITMLPGILSMMTGVMCAIVLLLGSHGKTTRRSRVVVGVLAGVAVAAASFAGFATSMQQLAASYAALMLASKTMEINSVRDLRVSAIMSFMPILICMTADMGVLCLIAAAVVVPSALGLLYYSCDRETGQAPATGAFWRYPLWAGARLGVALPFALLLFFLLPRLDNPMWGQHETKGKTGMSDTMSPGDFNTMLNDPSHAFSAFFDQPLPVGFQPYWRAVVLTRFDGKTWSVQTTADSVQASAQDTGQPIGYTLQIEGQKQPYLPALDVPLATSDVGINMRRDMTFVSRKDWMLDRRVRMTSSIGGHYTNGIGDQERMMALALPEGFNPKAIKLAQNMRATAGNEEQFIRQVGNFFNKELTYTLEPPLLGRDRVDELLFETKLGLCEHFASAFAVMMRAGGVPARVVTGYQGGELNEARDYYSVQQLYAHAWTEVWREGQGWQRIDPTAFVTSQRPMPEETRDGLAGMAGMGGLVGWLSNSWKNTIGEFDANTQRYMAHNFLTAMRGGSQARQAITWLTKIAAGLAIVMGVGGFAWWLLQRTGQPRKRKDPLENAWQQACQRLVRRVGGSRNLTAQQAIALARDKLHPRAANSLARLARRYSRAQYAPGGHRIERMRLALELRRWRAGRTRA